MKKLDPKFYHVSSLPEFVLMAAHLRSMKSGLSLALVLTGPTSLICEHVSWGVSLFEDIALPLIWVCSEVSLPKRTPEAGFGIRKSGNQHKTFDHHQKSINFWVTITRNLVSCNNKTILSNNTKSRQKASQRVDCSLDGFLLTRIIHSCEKMFLIVIQSLCPWRLVWTDAKSKNFL